MTADDPLAPYAGARVLVLGASGFIGAWLARTLATCDAELHLAARDPEAVRGALGALASCTEQHALDARDPRALSALLAKLKPAVTFNAIGYGVARDERDAGLSTVLNTQLPGWIADGLGALRLPTWSGQRLVHLGSALEYGTATGDLDETGPHSPTTLYGQTKLAGTRALAERAAALRLPATCARLFTVYGPGEHAGRLLPSLLAARDGDTPIPLTAGLQKRDFTYVEEVAEALLRVGATPGALPAALNLATGKLHTVRRFVEVAAEVLELDPQRLIFGALPTRPEEMEHGPVRVRRLSGALGWQPMLGLAEGLRRTAEFADAMTAPGC